MVHRFISQKSTLTGTWKNKSLPNKTTCLWKLSLKHIENVSCNQFYQVLVRTVSLMWGTAPLFLPVLSIMTDQQVLSGSCDPACTQSMSHIKTNAQEPTHYQGEERLCSDWRMKWQFSSAPGVAGLQIHSRDGEMGTMKKCSGKQVETLQELCCCCCFAFLVWCLWWWELVGVFSLRVGRQRQGEFRSRRFCYGLGQNSSQWINMSTARADKRADAEWRQTLGFSFLSSHLSVTSQALE